MLISSLRFSNCEQSSFRNFRWTSWSNGYLSWNLSVACSFDVSKSSDSSSDPISPISFSASTSSTKTSDTFLWYWFFRTDFFSSWFQAWIWAHLMLFHFKHLLDFVQADQCRRFAIKTYGKICLFIINEYFAIFLTTALGHGGLLAKQYFCDRCMCTWDEILRQEFWANLHILIEGINYHICIVARIAVQTDCQVPLLSIYVHFDISQASRKPSSHFWPFFKGITVSKIQEVVFEK